jgi:hypothetical protein
MNCFFLTCYSLLSGNGRELDAKFRLQKSDTCQYLLREDYRAVNFSVDLAFTHCHHASLSCNSISQGDSCNAAKYLTVHYHSLTHSLMEPSPS